jgi:preprotein translocase subunit SecF
MIQLAPQSWFFLCLWLVALGGLVYWGQTFRHKQRDLMGHINIYFAVSGLFLAIAIGSLATKGLNYGLDFTGGTIVEMAVYKQTGVNELQAMLAQYDQPKLGDQLVQVGADMVPDETGKPYQRVVIRVTRAVPGADDSKNLVDKEPQALYDYLAGKLGEVRQLRIASIGPTMTGELKTNAFLAMGIALVAQCLYIFVRFGFQFRFGLAADLAIVHDVVIMVGLYSLAGRQLDSPFVAAILTVAGYSVMDSVVIFDRIRENMGLHRNRDFTQVVNESVNQTMTRSINTTMTVIITLLSIYFLGGSTLQNFAFALLVGITSGAYSSIFVASPLLVLIDRWSRKNGHSSDLIPASAAAILPDSTPSGKAVEEAGAVGEAPMTASRRRRGPRRAGVGAGPETEV